MASRIARARIGGRGCRRNVRRRVPKMTSSARIPSSSFGLSVGGPARPGSSGSGSKRAASAAGRRLIRSNDAALCATVIPSGGPGRSSAWVPGDAAGAEIELPETLRPIAIPGAPRRPSPGARVARQVDRAEPRPEEDRWRRLGRGGDSMDKGGGFERLADVRLETGGARAFTRRRRIRVRRSSAMRGSRSPVALRARSASAYPSIAGEPMRRRGRRRSSSSSASRAASAVATAVTFAPESAAPLR